MRTRLLVLAMLLAGCSPMAGQPSRDELLAAARALVDAAPFASLATVNEDGRPQVRVMDATSPDSGWVVWLATNPRSRKVGQIRAHPEVALHWTDPEGPGYVTLLGRAFIVDDPDEKRTRWKTSWDPFYPGGPEGALLIEVVPHRLELISIPHGLEGDPTTWRPEIVEFARRP